MALRRKWVRAAAKIAACTNQIAGGEVCRYGQLRVLGANSAIRSSPAQSQGLWSRLGSSRALSNAVQAVQVPAPWREFPASGHVFLEETQIGTKTVTFETGKLARFAAGAAVVSIKDTRVLTTVVSDHTRKEGMDFLPLQVEYREKQYAQGKIPSTFMRREGGPNERELLCGRVIDRSIRPLFPRGFFFETQIIANVLCSDGEQDPDVLSVNAASAALTISNIPWNGPIGAVRVGRVNGKLIVNPNMDEVSKSDLNLVYACTATNALMIETQAAEITNKDYAAALHLAHSEAMKLIEPQVRLAAKVRNEKRPVHLLTVPISVLEKIRSLAEEPIRSVMENPLFGKFERGKALTTIQDSVEDILKAEGDEDSVQVLGKAFDAVRKEVVRGNVLAKGQRVDGRPLTEVRELYCEAGLHPALHGSSLFSRGNTQVLCTVTMGAPDDAQRLDSIVGPDSKRFMVHYSFPPYSVNEVGRLGGLNRREVGHGTLAEKALLSLLPSEDDFPYSVRVTSEVLASDGSSSMATVCGGSLALMDAGVPLREHAAGVSIGLMTVTDKITGEVKNYKLLTDILGLEDHLGDMDFKIAGTRQGITAVQLDMKLPGIPLPILIEALEPALVGRSHIIDAMERVILKAREDLRENLPRRGQMTILRESIGRLIGPQGTTIRNIQRMTGAKLNVSDDGVLTIFARDQACYDQTKEMVEACIGREVEVGGSYFATVVAIKDFGAFVELEGGLQGMVHISEISHNKVARIGDVLMLGQQLKVVCIGRDMRGNLKLSRKAAMTPEEESATLVGPSSAIPKMTTGLLERNASLGNQVKSSVSAVPQVFLKQTSDEQVTTRTTIEETVDSTSLWNSDVNTGAVKRKEEVSFRTSVESSPSPSTSTTIESHKRRTSESASLSSDSTLDEGSSTPKNRLKLRRQSVRTKAKSNRMDQESSFDVENRGE